MLARLATTCYRRRRAVLLLWVVLFVGLGAAQGAAGSAFSTQFRLPNTESRTAYQLLKRDFPGGGSGLSGSIVFRAEPGIADPAVKTAMTAMIEQVRALPGLHVLSPYEPDGAQQVSQAGPEAGKIAFATVDVPPDSSQTDLRNLAKQIDALIPAGVGGLQVELGGQVFAKFEPPSSETLGLAFAIVILLVSFGSVLAMGLPVGVALAGIGTGAGIVTLLSHSLEMPDFTLTLAVMIGLGVGIDYALFIVTRFREGLHRGLGTEDAIVTAIDTAGRAVLFAGITVVISLLGMLLMGLAFVRGLAIGSSITVLLTMLASITLLPALLGFAAHRLELTRYRSLIAVLALSVALFGLGLRLPILALVAVVVAVVVFVAGFAVEPLRRYIPRKPPKPMRDTMWYRWSRVVQHHSWITMLGGLAVLVLLGLPVLGLRLGTSDEGNYPTDTTTRRAYDLISSGFGPGFNGQLILAAEVPAGTDPAKLAAISQAVAQTEGVAFASPAIPNNPAAMTAALWRVVPTSAPQDEATSKLVHRLRSDVLPAATAGTGLRAYVGGNNATNIDFADYLARRTPVFFAAVLTLSFLLLMAVFRSLLVPLKAVIVNLLSIGAAYGLVVAVFQWGWFGGLFGVGKGPIEAFIPMMMFAIVFGLSMDYEVFLLSRMKEEFDRTGDNGSAVADGLAVTARVITAAASIMVFVFGSFVLESLRTIKVFGLGLASAVLLDATVVRMIIVPAMMELMGRANWWMPRWLDRILPQLHVEAPEHPPLAEPVGEPQPA